MYNVLGECCIGTNHYTSGINRARLAAGPCMGATLLPQALRTVRSHSCRIGQAQRVL